MQNPHMYSEHKKIFDFVMLQIHLYVCLLDPIISLKVICIWILFILKAEKQTEISHPAGSCH